MAPAPASALATAKDNLPSRRDQKPPQHVLLGALIAFGVGAVAWISGLVAPLDRAATDLETHWLQHPIDSSIAIVEIDARSLHELGTWPWRRVRHAELLEKLQALGAKRIFVDIDFSAPAPEPEDDARLAHALNEARANIVVPAFWQPLATGQSALILSEPAPEFLYNRRVHLGAVNLTHGSDGLVRDVEDLSSLSSRGIPPVWQQLQRSGSTKPAGAILLDYRIDPASFDHLSYADLLTGREHPDLSGRTVFVGATAIELGDMVSVPLHGALPGVVVQALAFESAARPPLRAAPPALILATLLGWSVLCAGWLSRMSWKRVPLAAPILLVLPLVLALTAYGWLNLLVPAAALLIVAAVSVAVTLLQYLDLETLRSWRALLRVRHQDALMRQLAAVSTDGILILDSDGLVREANAAVAEMLGVTQPALLHRQLETVAPALRTDFQTDSVPGDILRRTLDLSRPDGSVLPVEVVFTKLAWEDSFVVSISVRDVSAQRRREADLRYEATHDRLTGLGNRHLLTEVLEGALGVTRSGMTLAVLMADLNGFEQVRDIFGYGTSDELLIEVARRFRSLESQGVLVVRFDEDEFAMLVQDGAPSVLDELIGQIRSLAAIPTVAQGVPISLEARIGISRYPADGADAELLMRRANVALANARKMHNEVVHYDVQLDASGPRRLHMVSELRTAIERDEMQLHFQPKVCLKSGQVTEVEALCRWRSPVFGDVSPAEFMPLVEASDLIEPFTEWTIRRAVECCRNWHEEQMPLKVAVNLSARHLQDRELAARVDRLLRTTGCEAKWLELEITESAIMGDTDRAVENLAALRAVGVTLSIDDFGTGYSSLAYLQKLTVHRLKIDKSFVARIAESAQDRLIVKSTIDLARGLGLEVVAEGIETTAQYSVLQRLGCTMGQGYLISRPLPEGVLRKWYADRGASPPAHPALSERSMVGKC